MITSSPDYQIQIRDPTITLSEELWRAKVISEKHLVLYFQFKSELYEWNDNYFVLIPLNLNLNEFSESMILHNKLVCVSVGTIYIFDIYTSRCVHSFCAHKLGFVHIVRVDDYHIATYSECTGQTIKIWNLVTTTSKTISVGEGILGLALLNDGRLISCHADNLTIWNPTTCRCEQMIDKVLEHREIMVTKHGFVTYYRHHIEVYQ